VTIFEGLLMAHLLGDWLLQTEWQAQNKASNWRAMLSHVVVYHAIVFIVLYFGFQLRAAPTIAVVLVLSVLHAILDRKSVIESIMKRLRITVHREPERWLIIAVDQSVHLLLLGGASLYLGTVLNS
jgi:hypothetical protein